MQCHKKEDGKAGKADGRTEQEAGTRFTGHDELFGKQGGVCVCAEVGKQESRCQSQER